MNQKHYFGAPNFCFAFLLSVLCSAFAPLAGAAAPDPWATDRPDATEGSTVVGKDRTQLETGVLFSESDAPGGDTSTSQIGGSLLRVGYWENVELRFIWDGWIDRSTDGSGGDADGIGSTYVGTKWSLVHEDGKKPEIALLAHVSLPTGDADIASDRMDPDFRFSLSNTLTETLSIGYNAGLAWESTKDAGGDRDQLSSYVYTVSLDKSHSERLGTFIEFFGSAPASASGGPANSIDGGMTYRARDRIQLDLYGGVGVSDASDDWFIGSGVSILFD